MTRRNDDVGPWSNGGPADSNRLPGELPPTGKKSAGSIRTSALGERVMRPQVFTVKHLEATVLGRVDHFPKVDELPAGEDVTAAAEYTSVASSG
jgi:hypothetical protein